MGRGIPGGEVEEEEADPRALWHALITEVAKAPGKHRLKLHMQELKAVSYRGGVLCVAYDEDVPPDCVSDLTDADNLAFLGTRLHRFVPDAGARVLVKRWSDAVSNDDDRPQLTATEEVCRKVEKNPFVSEVRDLFGGTVIDVRG